jgi:hypothetical protein
VHDNAVMLTEWVAPSYTRDVEGLPRTSPLIALFSLMGFSLMGFSLTACTELVEDTGRACVIPQDLICECSGGEPCGPQLAVYNSQSFVCEGHYLANQALEVTAALRLQALTPGSDAQCVVEVVDRRIEVSASYREHPERDRVESGVEAHCVVPPLEPGTWTLVYDGLEQTFVVGEDAPQPMACVGDI